jgi:hypothetical protein
MPRFEGSVLWTLVGIALLVLLILAILGRV